MSESSSHISLKLIVLLLAAIVILGGEIGSYYYTQQLNSRTQPRNSDSSHSGGSRSGGGNSSGTSVTYYDVYTLINYGNQTSTWYNETKVPVKWNFYNLTIFLTDGNVQSQYYPSFNEHYILAINGVRQDSSSYWSLWAFCQKDSAWVYSSVGADDIALSNSEILAWYFESYASNAPPVTGALTLATCSS